LFSLLIMPPKILKGKVVFVMGEEVKGIAPEILKLADIVAEISMCGQKESLNVSVATGIALFRLLD
jgi:tRNA G18 (ribose-2'-O)-methylase SpoU